jgi:hypothetical protein
MDTPQQQQQVIPANTLRLPDLRLQAGPRELEFEIELPKGAQWDEAGENSVAVTSSAPQVVASGEARFNLHAMFFMIPLTALHSGETLLTYEVRLAWTERTGEQCTDTRQVVQRVYVETGRGATVPWVHYKAQCNGVSSVTAGDHPQYLGDS